MNFMSGSSLPQTLFTKEHELREQYFDFEGSRIHFVTAGNPSCPPLFLVHSFYVSWGIFKPYFELLAPKFFLVAPDLPGFGQSEMLRGVNNTAAYARLLESLRSHLNLERIYLFGFSAGGIVALKYAADYPGHPLCLSEQGAPYYFKDYDIILRDKLLLWASAWPLVPRLLQSLARRDFVWELLRRVSKNLDTELKVMEKGLLEEDIRRLNARAAYEWGRDILKVDLRKDLEKIKCPVQIIIGGKDPYLTLDSVKRKSGMIRNSRLEVVGEADHELTIKNPPIVAERLLNFFL